MFKKLHYSTSKNGKKQGVEIDLCLDRRKGEAFFKRLAAMSLRIADHLGDAPSCDRFNWYRQSDVGCLSRMNVLMHCICAQMNLLIPCDKNHVFNKYCRLCHQKMNELQHHWDYIYEPDDAKELLDKLLTRYIESQVYRASLKILLVNKQHE